MWLLLTAIPDLFVKQCPLKAWFNGTYYIRVRFYSSFASSCVPFSKRVITIIRFLRLQRCSSFLIVWSPPSSLFHVLEWYHPSDAESSLLWPISLTVLLFQLGSFFLSLRTNSPFKQELFPCKSIRVFAHGTNFWVGENEFQVVLYLMIFQWNCLSVVFVNKIATENKNKKYLCKLVIFCTWQWWY